MQEKKILNKMIKIIFETIVSTKDVKSSLLIKHFLFALSMNFASVGVIGPGVHIYVYIGPGAQSEDIK